MKLSRNIMNRLFFWLGLALVLYTPFIDTTVDTGNVSSDLAVIESLVERGTFSINGSTFEYTIDKFKRGDQFYSHKPALIPILGAAVYYPLHRMGYSLAVNKAWCMRVIIIWLVILPMGCLLWLVFNHPWLRQRRFGVRVGLTLSFAMGSLLTPLAVTLNHYTLASACIMAAVVALTKGLQTAPVARDAKWARSLGLRLGWWPAVSLACDVPPAFLLGLGLGSWLVVQGLRHVSVRQRRSEPWRMLGWMAVGALPLLVMILALNFQIQGSALPVGTTGKSDFEYQGSIWKWARERDAAGFVGYYESNYGRRVYHATLGHKGVYWMMPMLALALGAGLWLAARRRPGWPLALAWIIFLPITILFTAIWSLDLGGGVYVLRHAVAAVPPLFCILGHPAIPWGNRRLQAGAWAASLCGCLVAAIGLMQPWSHNTLSAYPPVENLARLALKYPDKYPTEWIKSIVPATSFNPRIGWLDLGISLMKSEKYPGAEEALIMSIKAAPNDPENADTLYHLGIVQALQNRPLDAIQTYDLLLRLNPDNIGAWNNRGRFAMNAQQWAVAEQSYRESLARAPGNASGLFGMLLLDDMKGNTDPASPLLQEALRRYPQDARFKNIQQSWMELRNRR